MLRGNRGRRTLQPYPLSFHNHRLWQGIIAALLVRKRLQVIQLRLQLQDQLSLLLLLDLDLLLLLLLALRKSYG